MLQAMRKHAKYFYVLFFIVILSFIFWGVGTVDKSTAVSVVEINSHKITVEEYWRAYDRAREFYRNIAKEAFTEEMEKQLNLKQKILDSLIEEVVLLEEAKRTGISVTDTELEDAIVNDPVFLRDGRFSKDIYVRALQLNRLTPELYESMKRRELTVVKMRKLVGESVDLPDAPLSDPSLAPLKQQILAEKRDKAVKSYVEGLKKQMNIKVNDQLIS